MRLLILGGTRFAGRSLAERALTHDWDVTTFNRGRSGPDVDGVRLVRGDRASRTDLAGLAEVGPWDAVVDTSGYVPKAVLETAKLLRPLARRYVFLSTVSVYRDWPREPLTEQSDVLYCPPDADETYGEDVEDGPTQYGYQKAGCEAAVSLVFGADAVSLRPGVVLGPREYVGRLPWWLRRISAAGEVVAPGDPSRTIQPIDVRDLADFALTCAQEPLSGAYNVAAPIGGATFGRMLQACADVTGTSPELVWIPDDVLIREGVRQWSELPLWRTYRGTWQVDPGRALAAGLRSRSIVNTVSDTWKWMNEGDLQLDNERASEIGLTPDQEARILAAVR